MAQSAFITLDGKETKIKGVSYKLIRHVEQHGKPATRVRGGTIHVHKDSIYDKNAIVRWMSDPDLDKEGQIVIYTDERKKDTLKTIKWKHGYIIEHEESYVEEEEKSNTEERFVISAEFLTIEDAEFDFYWPESNT